MRRFSALITTLLLTATGALLGCGGHKSSSGSGIPAKINLGPATVSLNLGSVDTSLTTSVVDVNNATVSTAVPLTFASSNPTVASVSPGGSVCGGSWDSSFVVCKPGPVGTATITASGAGLTSNAITVYVHQRVDSILVFPASVDCRSQGQTQQMVGQALVDNPNGTTTDITATVGPFSWITDTTEVATIDTANNGLLTANTPGSTHVFATLTGANNANSVPATFITCPVKTIAVHVSGGTAASTTLSTGGTQAIETDVVDTHGNSLTNVPLTFNSSLPAVGSASSTTVTAVAAGTNSIVVSCTPDVCNKNLFPVYSNVFTETVSGTSTTTVFVGNTGSTSLYPIDTSTNTVGTAITLPATPTSMLFGPGGTYLVLGASSGGIMVVNAAASPPSATQVSGLTGTPLAISSDSTRLAVSDVNLGKVFIYNVSSSSLIASLSIPGATRATFSPDGLKAYILAGNTMYVYSQNATLKTVGLAGTGNDVSFVAGGWFGYVARPGAITAYATCSDVQRDSVSISGNPTMLAAVPDGTKLLAVNSPSLNVIGVQSDGAGCPPSLTDTPTTLDLGQGNFTPRQMFVLSNSSKAYIISDLGSLLAYDIGSNTATPIALSGGATPTTGGATPDGATLYVGGSDSNVHRIDVASGSDAQQIPISFVPDLVAVRP